MKKQSLLERLDTLDANTLVTISLTNGQYFTGYISGVSAGELIDLHDAPASILPNGKSVVIDGCEVVTFRVE